MRPQMLTSKEFLNSASGARLSHHRFPSRIFNPILLHQFEAAVFLTMATAAISCNTVGLASVFELRDTAVARRLRCSGISSLSLASLRSCSQYVSVLQSFLLQETSLQ